jgi:YHS domain-containing protein
VGLLARIIRFLIWTVFISGILWLLRKVFRRMEREAKRATPARASGPAHPLHRDPVCGTFVAEEVAFKQEAEGMTYFFCSMQCREEFRSGTTGRRAANG